VVDVELVVLDVELVVVVVVTTTEPTVNESDC
jgi:hypothetical protein